MATGLPVITTPVSVLSQLIGESNGILLDKAEPSTLARAIVELCSDHVRYRTLSANAIEKAKDFTLESWQELIGKKLSSAWNVKSLRELENIT